MKCTHTTSRWETVELYRDYDTDELVTEQRLVERTLFQDIDIHRVKCMSCGKIKYYSGAAREYYEEGKRNPIVELGIQNDLHKNRR